MIKDYYLIAELSGEGEGSETHCHTPFELVEEVVSFVNLVDGQIEDQETYKLTITVKRKEET